MQLSLKVLLIGTGSSDPTTAAWESALSSEGVPYTEVTATGSNGAETVSLPALTTGAAGNFNGVVLADSPSAFAVGQLTALDSYEASMGVRQVDGYMYPSPSLGLTDATAGALDGTTGTLTAAGLAALPGLTGTIPFDTGTYGYPSTVGAGTPFTPWLENTAGRVLAGVYQHPSTDPQAGVSELSLTFDYNATSQQWLLLAPGIINWVTQDTHLGLYRNYFGQDVDDNFIADNEWSSQYQCTPAATDPVDYTCPTAIQGADPGSAPGVPADVQMSAADVAHVVAWEQQTGITLNMAFNGIGACTAPTAGDESSANCTGSVTDPGGTYADPGQTIDQSYPDDQGLINALLADKADFNWINHTWSHQFLGCIVWQPQAVNSVTANASGGSFTAGSYSYEVTAATAYGESEPSLPKTVTVGANGSVTISWPDATNGIGTTGTAGPTLSQEEANHTGGTGFWGYNIYRENPGSSTFGLVGDVPEDPTGATATYTYTDTGATAPGATPDSSDTYPTATNPGIDCSSAAGSWDPATSTTPDASIEQEIGMNQAFATANGLPNFVSTAVVTGEHSGIENPNMPTALAGTGVTTFAADASRQPTQYAESSGANTAESAPRYPNNIYYNASNWVDELNEYNTLYVDQGISLGNATYPSETGHCADTSATTCLAAPATEATFLASESHIMLSHVLANNPRVQYDHQTDLIGPDYTLLTLISNMLSQYDSWYTSATPISQVTDSTESQILGEQSGWAAAQTSGTVNATELNGVVTVTNTGTGAVAVPITVPPGTTVGSTPAGTAFGQSYGGQLSAWTSVPAAGSVALNENLAPAFTSASAATSIVGTPFTFTVAATGNPAPTLTETGPLPTGITFTGNANGTATIAGTAAAGTGGSYPITITASNVNGTASQAFTLTNGQLPVLTSAASDTVALGASFSFPVTATGYPAPALTEAGTLPPGVTFTPGANGAATLAGKPTTAGAFPITITATSTSGTATQSFTLTVDQAPTITSAASDTVTLGAAFTFPVTTTGYPAPALTETGTLPAGVTFKDNGNGTATLAGKPTAAGAFPMTITAANTSGSVPQTFTLSVNLAPALTSASSSADTLGAAFTFPVTTTGYPLPALTESGGLPAGVTFKDNGNGTATLAGTPTATGTFPITITATSTSGTATQSFTLTINQAPTVTSAASDTVTLGAAFTFPVTATGYPAPALTESGGLPAGVTFKDNGNGTATLAGTPTATGTFPITITATDGTGTTTQSYTLTVQQAPTITSAAADTVTSGAPLSFKVTTTGYPAATLTKTGALPAGVTFTAGAGGTATLAGTPTATGAYPITITATSAAGKVTQSFTLTVNQAPAFISASSYTLKKNTTFSFKVVTTGYPAATLTKTGALPAGVTFTAGAGGSATIAGTPTALGAFPITITATSASGKATQNYTLTVEQAPAFTSAATYTATVGTSFSFKVTTTGYPAATLTKTGTLPAGVTFTAGANGTATLAGKPTTLQKVKLTFTATSALGTVTQSFTISIT